MSLWRIHRVSLTEFHNIELVAIGDTHLGHKDCDMRVIHRYLEWLKEKPNRFCVLMGDMLEFVVSTKKVGTALMSQVLTVDQQIDLFYELFRPVKDKILAFIGGNHEQRLGKVAEKSLVKELARELDIEHWAERDMMVEIKVGRTKYLLYLNHGDGSSITPDFQLKRAILTAGIGNVVDAVLIGHIHQLFAHPYPVVTKRQSITTRDVWGIRTGTALGYADYAKSKLYSPSNTGFPILRLSGYERKILVALGLDRIGWGDV
jgi:hypothetical protein